MQVGARAKYQARFGRPVLCAYQRVAGVNGYYSPVFIGTNRRFSRHRRAREVTQKQQVKRAGQTLARARQRQLKRLVCHFVPYAASSARQRCYR